MQRDNGCSKVSRIVRANKSRPAQTTMIKKLSDRHDGGDDTMDSEKQGMIKRKVLVCTVTMNRQ